MPSGSKKLSAKARATRNRIARESYHRNKDKKKRQKHSDLNAIRGLPAVHIQAAAKRLIAAIHLQLKSDPYLTDLIITAHVLAKAVLEGSQ